MTDVIAVALITGLSTGVTTLAGVFITQRFESARQERASRGAREEAGLARTHELGLQRRSVVTEERRRQATDIRKWIREQLTASVDIDHLFPTTLTHGQNPVFGQMAAAAAAHVGALIAARSASPETMSVNRVLADVSSAEVVASVRALLDAEKAMRDALTPVVDFVKATPMPWDDERAAALWKLNEPLAAAQRAYDERLATLNHLLESYVAGDDLADSPTIEG